MISRITRSMSMFMTIIQVSTDELFQSRSLSGSYKACEGCTGASEVCVANQNSLIPADDDSCAPCTSGQSYWPCDTEGLCWCWDNTKPKKPPAPSSGLELTTSGKEACDLFTEELFTLFAPNNTFPYTYQGLCDAISDYNLYHTEKIFMMGTENDQRKELAAFLGNTAHESDDYEAGREYLVCGDRKEVEGKVYCKPCNQDSYDFETNVCNASMVDQNSPYNSYCQPSFEPPEGCKCETITQVSETGELAGYVEASKVFYGRGALQLSWNYNYIRASFALTGKSETFCDDPEVVSTNELYAWGSAIYFWMENEKEETTCHKEALKHNFGGALNNINGGLECPASHGGWHATAIKMRINRYCHAASLLGLTELGSMSGCKGLNDSYAECLSDGSCTFCEEFGNASTNSDYLGNNDTNSTLSDEIDSNETIIEQTTITTAPAFESNGIDTGESDNIAGNETYAEASELTTFPSIALIESSFTPTNAVSEDPSLSSSNATPVSLPPMINSTKGTSEMLSPSIVPTVNSNATIFPEKNTSQIDINATTMVPSSAPNETVALVDSTQIPTLSPSYSPSTPAPTMGPCDGEACPDELCRSPWGFCGDGDEYCNEKAVWSSSCGEKSAAPSSISISSETSMSPLSLNDSLAVIGLVSPTNSSIDTNTDTAGSFTKPKPNKKPPLPKPGSEIEQSSNSTDNVTLETMILSTPLPTSLPTSGQPTHVPTEIPVTEAPTVKSILIPNDSIATYFCGNDWVDANKVCAIPCPSGKSEECPGDQSCYAYTTCNEPEPPSVSPSLAGIITEIPQTTNATSPNITNSSGLTPNASIPLDGISQPSGCAGKPCEIFGECRSQYGFCGKSFVYCNDLSSWTLEKCGLFGKSMNGTTMLCDADFFDCPNGDQMNRNPELQCKFFPCVTNDESDTSLLSLAVPVSSPTLPELPKPTLPTITDPEKPDLPLNLPFGTKPSNTINISISNSSKLSNHVVIIDNINEVTDDTNSSLELKDGSFSQSESEMSNFNSFSYEEWMSVGHLAKVHWMSTICTIHILLCTFGNFQ